MASGLTPDQRDFSREVDSPVATKERRSENAMERVPAGRRLGGVLGERRPAPFIHGVIRWSSALSIIMQRYGTLNQQDAACCQEEEVYTISHRASDMNDQECTVSEE
ncbi:MAG: hypothetical protein TREMPRED_003111, partial [Tremellales sp. Tagirdzhanova-0007]